VAAGNVKRFADGKQPDSKRRHLDAVKQLRHAERQPCLSGQLIEAHKAEPEPEGKACQPAKGRRAERRRDGDEGNQHQPEIIPGRELDRHLDQKRCHEGEADRGDQRGNEGTDRGGRESRTAAPRARHLVAF
jgi:hypothetical protein